MADQEVLYLGQVRRLMVKHFDQEELETLAFDLGIPWGELPGVGPSAKSRSLITCLAERGRIDELAGILAEERPHVDWPEIPDSSQQVQDIAYLAPAIPEEQARRDERYRRSLQWGGQKRPAEYRFSASKSKLRSDLVRGVVLGFAAGLVCTFLTWFAVGLVKQLLTWDTPGVWPEGFPGHIPDFILSRWWALIIIVTFTVGGAIAASIGRRRLDIL